MATKKLKKYPKKPKASSSLQAKGNYLARVREIDKENVRIKADNKKSADLSKKIANVGRAK